MVCLWRDFLSLSSLSLFPTTNVLQKKTQSDDDALFFVVSFSVYFGSDEDAERAEKTERGERFFVGWS